MAMLVCVACQYKLRPNEDDSQKPLVEIKRYDRLEYRYLTTGDITALQQMQTDYPMETRTLLEDLLKIGEVKDPEINTKFLKFYQDTTLQVIIADVEAQYANMDDLNRDFNAAFTRLKHWLPDLHVPEVYAQITALDESIVIGDQSIGISLDKYLGKDYPVYQRFNYTEPQREQMERDMILPEALSYYLISQYPLKGFESRPQIERDLHMGKVMWIANQAIGHPVFRTRFVLAVDNFMRRHADVSYEELLRMTDFSQFQVK